MKKKIFSIFALFAFVSVFFLTVNLSNEAFADNDAGCCMEFDGTCTWNDDSGNEIYSCKGALIMPDTPAQLTKQ